MFGKVLENSRGRIQRVLIERNFVRAHGEERSCGSHLIVGAEFNTGERLSSALNCVHRQLRGLNVIHEVVENVR